MPIFGKSRYLPNPIPFALYPRARNPTSLPLVARSSVPPSAVIEPKRRAEIRADHLSRDPVRLLRQVIAESTGRATESALPAPAGEVGLPGNLRAETLTGMQGAFMELSKEKKQEVLQHFRHR